MTPSTPPSAPQAALVAALAPLVAVLKTVSLADPVAARRTLENQAGPRSPIVAAVRTAAEAGARDGWLLPKENAGIRFGRVTKNLDGFAVDAVLMDRAGPRHRHPNGEIDLLFTRRGDARFDGHPEGWAVFGPDSVHVPTVTGGEMLILYFLPGGAIEFL